MNKIDESKMPTNFGIVTTADEIFSDLGISPDRQEQMREAEAWKNFYKEVILHRRQP
jgi:hypothetical protein